MALDIKVNRLPSITWNRLKINDAALSLSGNLKEATINTKTAYTTEDIDNVSALGPDVDALLKEHDIKAAAFSFENDETIKVDAVFPEDAFEAARVKVDAKSRAKVTLVCDLSSDGDGESIFQTVLGTEDTATIRLVILDRTNDNHKSLIDVCGKCEGSSRIEIFHIFLGNNTYSGCRIDLLGDESSLGTNIGYSVCENGLLDMNYVVNHIGKKTRCDIEVNGVLKEGANKTFRGTIDFKKGASGSVGNEREDVLLLDDNVINKTIPIILCSEEDVEGNHGATIGQVSDDVMFYMESRGISKDMIYSLLAKSRVLSVAEKTGIEELVDIVEKLV